MILRQPTLIVFCGHPASGKTSTATLLQNGLNEYITDPEAPKVHLADIDVIRHAALGIPYAYPNESDTLMKKDVVEMGGAYKLLLHAVEWHLAQKRSLIICATFSRRVGQQNLLDIYTRHFDEKMAAKEEPCAFRLIQCVPTDDTEERVVKLFANRDFGAGSYVGGVNSPERYFEVRDRYERILLPHLTLKTWDAHSPEECAEEAFKYIVH